MIYRRGKVVARSGDGSVHSDNDVALCHTGTMSGMETVRMGRSGKERRERRERELGFGPTLGFFSVFANFLFPGKKRRPRRKEK